MYEKHELDIRSRENVKDLGEVFTPFVIVDQMLELIPESFWKNPAACIIEPTCGNGQFLVKVFEKRVKYMGILEALNSMIGMDINPDNVLDSAFRLYERACAQLRVMQVKPNSKAWWDYAVKIVAIVRNNIIKVDDSLKVLNDYKQCTGVLSTKKFVFVDPTGNGEVMTETARNKELAKIVKAFDSHSTKPTRTLAPFFEK